MNETVKRPDLSALDLEIVSYILWLEKVVEGLGDNGAVYLATALNNQLRNVADQVQALEIDINNTDDKIFDRFVKLAQLSGNLINNFKGVVQEYGKLDMAADDDGMPAIEKMIRRSNKK